MYVRYDDGNSVAWVIAAPQPDIGQFVQKSGDTMSGDLKISKARPQLILDRTDPTGGVVLGTRAGTTRWLVAVGNGDPESSGNAGSNFAVTRYDDSGVAIDSAFNISRATGVADFAKKPTVAGAAWAAPMDALAYSGLQINGGFEVSQELGSTGFALPSAAKNFADGWLARGGGTFVASVQALTSVSIPGFASIARIMVSTGQPSLGATDYADILTRIEGYRISRLAWGTPSAQPITIGFWSNHIPVGTYALSVRNGPADRSYVTTYTHSVANVPQYQTITIPGCVDGTWPSDNTIGMTINFTMASSATNISITPSLNAWVNGNLTLAATQTNGVAAANNYFRITGLVVLPGLDAPSAARSAFIMRPFDQELVTCQRYYQKSYSVGVKPGTPSSVGSLWGVANGLVNRPLVTYRFSPTLRETPTTVTLFSPNTGASGMCRNVTTSADMAATIYDYGTSQATFFTAGTPANNDTLSFHLTADARL
jgi:hypothetical protein